MAAHLGFALGKLLVRDLEVLIDARSGDVTRGFISIDNGTEVPFSPDGSGRLVATLPAVMGRLEPTRLAVSWDAGARKVREVWADDQRLPDANVVTVRDVFPAPFTDFDVVVVRLPRPGHGQVTASVGLTLALLVGLLLLLHPVLERRRAARLGSPLSLLTYSDGWRAHVRRGDLLVGMGLVALTVFSVTGVDAMPIYNILRISGAGLDAYQFQVSHKALRHFEFLSFPYNPLMLGFWTFFDRPWGALFGTVPPIAGQTYVQLLMMKLVNGGLVILTSLALISFASEEGLLRGRGRLVFYLALLNPLVFYVAVVYVHLDPAPLYLVTLGTLFCHRFERHGLLGPLLVAAGCAMKAQGILLLPTALLAFVLNALCQREALATRLRTLVAGLGTAVAVLVLFVAVHMRKGTPLHDLLTHFSQAERIWFSQFPYVAEVVLYLTPFAVVLVLLRYVFSLRFGLTSKAVIASALLASGALVTAYNATHLHTPGTLLQMGGALMLVLLMEDDPLRRLSIWLGTLLIVATWYVAPTGDITRIIPGHEGTIFRFYWALDLEKRVRFQSVFFTFSVAGMVAYMMLFMERARALVHREEPAKPGLE